MKKRIISILLCAILTCTNIVVAYGSELPETGPAHNSTAEIPTDEEADVIGESEAELIDDEPYDGIELEESESVPDIQDVESNESAPLTEDRTEETAEYVTELEADSVAEMSEELVGTTVGLDAVSRTQSAIRKFVLESGASESASLNYTKEPVTDAGAYAAGTLSDASLKNALALVNNYRYIAGLSYNVKLDSSYTQKAQAAALLLAINGEISRAPKKPSGMSDSLYNKGYDGAQNSNLNYGASTLGSASLAWIKDNSVLNQKTLPNRTALLEPTLGKVGFGAVGRYYAAYIRDTSAASNITKVAWPAQNMPIDYFADSDPWSVTGISFDDASKVKVTLVRVGDNRTWIFSKDTAISSSDSGYFTCSKENKFVTFKPNDITYMPGDKFSVKIEGIKEGTLSYTVNFFELVPLQNIQLRKTSTSLEYGRSAFLYYEITPENATSRKAVWTSSDPSVCSVSTFGNIHAHKLGTAIITLQMGDVSSSCKVTVTRRNLEITTGFAITPSFYYYSGAANKPGFSKYSVDNVELVEGKDYTLSYKNNVRPGNGKIYVTGIGNYTGNAEYSFNIYPFEDVRDPAHPYYTAICWAVENGITKGYTGTHIFGINDACTRGHAVCFLWRMAGKPKPMKGAMKFIDVPKSHPYYEAILWAAQKNIAIGYPAYKEFRPDKPCTRGQICTFIWRYLGWKEPKSLKNPYKDSLTKPYRKAIIWMTEKHMANGYPDRTFRDPQTCTRGMMVKYLYNSRKK